VTDENKQGGQTDREGAVAIAAARLAPAPRDLNVYRYVPEDRGVVVTIPRIWLTLLASLLIHAVALWHWLPHLDQAHLAVDEKEPGKARPVLVTRLAPVPSPRTEVPPPPSPPRVTETPPAPVPRARASPPPPPAPRAPPRVAPATPPPQPKPHAAPPVIAAPTQPSPPPSPAPSAAPAPRPPAETDLASYIEARRRERGTGTVPTTPVPGPNASPTETETQRRDRVLAANLAPSEQPTFGYDPKRGGGVFQVKTVGYDYAEFYFTGWDKEIGRRAKELYEVRKSGSDEIKQTMVRKMIAIIRENVKSDSIWVSDRLGRSVTMSALPSDNAALEDFLMQEFFGPPILPNRRR